MKRAFTCLALVAAAYSAFGQAEIVGTWKGSAQLDMAKIPQPKDADQKKKLDSAVAMLKKMSVVLTLKKGGLYSVKVNNAPGGAASQTEEGTWKFSGTTLTTTATKQNGKPPKAGEKPQNLTYDKAKKHLVMSQGPLTMIFSK